MKRREFLFKTALGSLGTSAGILSLFPLERPISRSGPYGNPFCCGKKPLLLILRGKKPERILAEAFQFMLDRAAKPIPRQTWYIKPNATANEPYPVTSDVDLLRRIIGIFQMAGVRRVIVGDNPSYRGMMVQRIFSERGYFSLKRIPGVQVLPRNPTSACSYRKVSNSRWLAQNTIMVNRDLLNADLVVNTAMPKRHHESDFTCGLKNNFGAVYDPVRTQAHIRMRSGGVEAVRFFDRTVVECADAARPQLTIIDARSLLIKSGPSLYAGGEIKNGVNEIVISGDMLAADAYCSQLMQKHDPTFEPSRRLAFQLTYGRELGLGEPDLSRVEMLVWTV